MRGDLSILNSIAKVDSKYLDIYLEGVKECQPNLLKNDNAADLIGSLLSKSNTRKLGLRWLFHILDQCTLEVLEKRSSLWLTLILKACNGQEMSSYPNLIYDNLAKLTEKIQVSPELSRSLAINHLTKVYESLSIVPDDGYLSALKCLKIFLREYPGTSGQSRTLIERFLTRFVDTCDQELLQYSGECWLLLQQIRKGGVQNVTYKSQWKEYQIRLIGSLHGILNNLFSNCRQMYEGPVLNESLSLPELQLGDEPLLRTARNVVRFCNLSEYLRVALSESFPFTKEVLPKTIINIICRGLSVNSVIVEQNPISENLALSSLIPKMHCKLLELLETLILMLGKNLKIHSQLILELLVDTLKWTSTSVSKGRKQSFGNLRSSAYRLIGVWCATLNGGSFCETVSDQLIKEIISDILPIQQEFTLRVLSGSRKYMSKKARRQLNQSNNDQNTLSVTQPNESSIKMDNLIDLRSNLICIAALRCLQRVLMSICQSVKPSDLKLVQNTILKICEEFLETSLKKNHLYYDWKCRLEIFNTLHIFVLAPNYICPPSIQLIVNILKFAHMNDDASPIREHCQLILQCIEKVVHPQKESLLFIEDIKDKRNAFNRFRKVPSDDDCLSVSTSSNEDDNESLGDESCNEQRTDNVIDTTVQYNVEDNLKEICTPVKNQTENNCSELSTICSKSKTQENLVMHMQEESMLDCPKSPLRKTSSEFDVEINSEINSKLANIPHVDDSTLEPCIKKAKLSEISNANGTLSTVDSTLLEDDNKLIADLEATFVNEFN